MKILCTCTGGDCRSVAMSYLLKRLYDHDVLVSSLRWNYIETRVMLYNWAEKIIIFESEAQGTIPSEHHPKIICYDIGPDRWHNPRHPELLALLTRMLEERKELFP